MHAESRTKTDREIMDCMFTSDSAANFILGATYTQEDVPKNLRGKKDGETAAFCEARCLAKGYASPFELEKACVESCAA